MKMRFSPALILSLLSMTLPSRAQDIMFKSDGSNNILVELYSSEGCSSCPPAEAWMSNLKSSPDLWKSLFPVAFHVDYWDGLGWPDRFAKAAYTQRQKNYASLRGQDSIYTPEFVTGGREWRGWFHGSQTLSAPVPTSGQLVLNVKNGASQISATYSPSPGEASSKYVLNVALLGMDITSDVQRGENEGRQLKHDFVVLDFGTSPFAEGAIDQSGTLDLSSKTGDSVQAIVGWVSRTDGSIGQITGGFLKPGLVTYIPACHQDKHSPL